MPKTSTILIVFLSLILAGCGNSAANRLIGTWKYDFAKAAANEAGKRMGENGDNKAAAALSVVEAFGMKMEMILDFKADQTVNITASGIPFPFSGPMTWKSVESDGDKLTIEITNPKDKSTSKVQIAFIDNDHLQFSPPDSKAKSMEFERVKQ
jgi:hypothetical protein